MGLGTFCFTSPLASKKEISNSAKQNEYYEELRQ